MNAKERVQTALNHQEPDRVPRMMSAGKWVVERLKKHFGVQTDRELLKAMNIDIFDMRGIDYKGGVAPKYVGPASLNIPPDWCGDIFLLFNYHEEITENQFGKAHAMGPPCLKEYETIAELETYLWPQADWFDYSNVRPQLEDLAEDFAIACTGPSVLQHPMLFRGVEQFLLEMATDPDLAAFIADKVTDFYCDFYGRILEEAGDLIDILRIADDIGATNNLFISLKMLDESVGPRVKKLADLAHKYDVKVLFHSDGNIRDAIPAIIEWGVDILDPIQPEIPAMNAVELKQAFGDKLSFSGNVGAVEILPNGSVADVKAEVKRAIEQLGPGGGYILSPGHPSFQGDVPLENITAMYDAGLEYGTY